MIAWPGLELLQRDFERQPIISPLICGPTGQETRFGEGVPDGNGPRPRRCRPPVLMGRLAWMRHDLPAILASSIAAG